MSEAAVAYVWWVKNDGAAASRRQTDQVAQRVRVDVLVDDWSLVVKSFSTVLKKKVRARALSLHCGKCSRIPSDRQKKVDKNPTLRWNCWDKDAINCKVTDPIDSFCLILKESEKNKQTTKEGRERENAAYIRSMFYIFQNRTHIHNKHFIKLLLQYTFQVESRQRAECLLLFFAFYFVVDRRRRETKGRNEATWLCIQQQQKQSNIICIYWVCLIE